MFPASLARALLTPFRPAHAPYARRRSKLPHARARALCTHALLVLLPWGCSTSSFSEGTNDGGSGAALPDGFSNDANRGGTGNRGEAGRAGADASANGTDANRGGTAGTGGDSGIGGADAGGIPDGSLGGGGEEGGLGCPADRADCDRDDVNGCEVILASDAAHCGRCGHDCLGGGCSGGRCQPIVLADKARDAWLTSPFGIALDVTHAYFTVNGYARQGEGHLAKVPKAGGAVVDLRSGETGPLDIALYGQFVIWTNTLPGAGGVFRIAKTGGAPSPISAIESQPVGPATDDGFVYWASYASGRVRKATDVGTNALDLVTGQDGPRSALADPGKSGFVYFVTVNEGFVKRVSKLGGPAELISEHVIGPWALARDPFTTDLFFTRFTGLGDVRRIRAAPGSRSEPLVPANSIQTPYSLAVDETHVYFTTHLPTSGSVARVPKMGGTIEILASGQQAPAGVAVDGAAVYWTESDAHRVWKLAK
jgi:hypothetical protein